MAAPHHLLLLCYTDRFIYRRFVKHKAYVATNMHVNEGLEGVYYLTTSRVETEDNYESPNKDSQTRSQHSNPVPPELEMRISTVASLVFIRFI
jgi:hypothetical protein